MSIRKGDTIIAGTSVGFIGKPDWSQAVTVTIAQAQAGYIVPKDGIIVGNFTSATGAGVKYLTINGVAVAAANDNGSWASFGDCQIQVNKGDVVKVQSPSAGGFGFVPFEYSGVSDINIITPDYIRNTRTLDWANKVLIPFNQTQSDTWIVPSDGMIIGELRPADYTVLPATGSYSFTTLTLNGIAVASSEHSKDNFIDTTSVTLPVAKGDVIIRAVGGKDATGVDRSYPVPNKVYFIPYKQQIG